ncbi:MAG: PAS domain-containing protein [Clostridia bacterium]|nr:PAS domain-containing protein [Clostridia bacterium]
MLKRLDLTAFKKIYDKSAIAFAVINLIRNDEGVAYDFLYEYANQAMADIDGIKVSDLIGKKYSAIYKKYPPKPTIKNLSNVAENGNASSSQEYWNEAGLSVSMQYAFVAEDTVSVSVVGISNIEQMKNQNEQLVNRIPGGVVIIEVTDTVYFYHCNDWYHTTLGYTSEEFEVFQKENENGGIHPDDIGLLKDSIEECFNGKRHDTLTLRVAHKNGTYKYLCLNTAVVGKTDNKLTLYGMYTDVDKHIRLANKLAYVNAEMDNMIASIPGGISKYVLTEEGTLKRLYSSPGMAELVGKTQEEYERDFDKDWKDNIYYADFPIVQRKIVECVKTLKSTEFTYRLIHKDGSLVWVTALVRVIGEKDGRPLAHAVFHAMTKSEVLYQTLLDNIDTATIVRDITNGEILYANKTASEFFNMTEKQLMGKNYADVLKNNQIYIEEHRDILENNISKEIIIGNKCYNVTVESIVWNEREAVASFFTDITDSFKAREQLQGDKDKLDELVSKIPLGIAVFRLDKEDVIYVEHCNDTICDIINIDKDVIKYGQYTELSLPFEFYKDDLPAILNAFEIAKEQKEPYFFDFRIIYEDKKITWFTTSFQSIPQEDGSILIYAGFIDITGQKDLEEKLVLNAKELKESVVKLQESQERLNAISRRAELFYWEIELETGDATASFASVDSPSTNLKNEGFATDFIIPEDVEYFTLMTDLAASGKENHFTFDVRVGENIEKSEWYRITYDIIKDDEEKAVSLLGLAQNVNDLKLEQRRLDEEIENLETATQRRDVLSTMRINLTDNCVESYSSKPETQLDVKIGDKYTDVLEKIASHTVSGTEREDVLKHQSLEKLLASFENGENVVSVDYQIETYENASCWVNSTIRIYRHPVTKKVMCFIYCYDINDIHVTKEIINKVVEDGYEHISVINVKNRKIDLSIGDKKSSVYMKTNDVFDRSLMNAFARFGSDDLAESGFDNCCLSNVIEELKEKNEYAYPFNININGKKERKLFTYSWFDDAKTKILLLVTDITDVYQQEIKRSEELAKALDTAVMANKSKTDFLSRMSHEIRTPMNAILGMSRLGEDVATEENVVSYFKDINASGNYLLGLINDILDMSRIEQGKMDIYNKYEEFNEMIRSVEVVIKPLAERKKVDFRIIQSGEAPQWVYLDKLRAQQVYINILNNAIKFTESGGKVEWEIKSEMLSNNTVKVISKISDTGCGMSESFLGRIFEPFAQEQNSLVNARQGTGLGLAIAKSIVEKMGGTISVESTIGIGTTFTIEFTRNCKQINDKQNLNQEADDVKSILEGKKVLLCEDHPLNTLVATRLLEKVGMTVDAAENGKMGVEKFSESQENEYAVVLMDIRMPVMDGLEATTKIRALNRQDAKSVPIIAMTANAFAEDKSLSKSAGMNEHLSKPIEPAVLYKTLGDYIK